MAIFSRGDFINNCNVEYSEVESEEVTAQELRDNPENHLILDLKNIINCKRCRKRMTIKKNKNNITFLCGCGCRVIYPKNKDGNLVSNWIPKEEYLEREGHDGRRKLDH